MGKYFSVIVCRFLVAHKLPCLADSSSKEAAVVLKLFKLVFTGVERLQDADTLLAPHLIAMVDKSLKMAVEATDPAGFLHLLRSFFKASQLAAPKFKTTQVDFVPLLTPTLQSLLFMLNGPNMQELRHLLIELTLMLPVQLSSLLPSIHKLMRPLVMALRSQKDELIMLGLRTLEVWIDSLNPEFLEPAMSDVVHQLMSALWALLKPVSGHYATQGSKASLMSMQLLGKLGGRSRRFLKDPWPLEYRDNPEHGLRLILTFKPNTSFLVPLDKCVLLAKQGLFGTGTPNTYGHLPADKHDVHYRKQALTFLHTCLAAILNLRSPVDSSLQGTSIDKVVEMLLGNQPAPAVQPTPTRVDLGVKTKTQLIAERQVLATLLSAVIGAAADEKLADVAGPFAHGICRHFAMLFVAGAHPPPPAPMMARQSQVEGHLLAAMPPGLRELDVHLFLDALVEVLCDEAPKRARAALDGLSVFLASVMKLHAARKATKAAAAAAAEAAKEEAAKASGANATEAGTSDGAKAPETSAAGAAASAPAPAAAEGAAKEEAAPAADPASTSAGAKPAATAGSAGNSKEAAAAATSGDSTTSSRADVRYREKSYASQLGYPPVLDNLMPRILHCCWEDSWQARLGGAAGLRLLVFKLPADYLLCWCTSLLRGLLNVVKLMPEHSVAEKREVDSTLAALLRKCLMDEAAPKVGRDLPQS